MYVTRPLSIYKSRSRLLSTPPEEGPGSGYLVLQGEEDIEYVTSNSGEQMIDEALKDLPFPQNRLLTVNFTYGSGPYGKYTEKHTALFVPVMNKPLSCNCFYLAVADNNEHKGLAYTSATEEDTKSSCLLRVCTPDKSPEKFNPHDVRQQFQITKKKICRFDAKSVDPEGRPPMFLRRIGWNIHASRPKIALGEADGLNSTLRSQHPDFDFPISNKHSQPKIVGKWYCPFLFVEEGTPKERMESSMFYEMTLEQQWERIYSYERNEVGGYDNSVSVSVDLPTQVVKIFWLDAVSERDEANSTMWFWAENKMGEQTKVGLSLVLIERMMWEQARVGWAGGNEKQVKVARLETYTGSDSWKKFGCYALIERFVLKRLDGSTVLTYEFKHTHQIRCKWE